MPSQRREPDFQKRLNDFPANSYTNSITVISAKTPTLPG